MFIDELGWVGALTQWGDTIKPYYLALYIAPHTPASAGMTLHTGFSPQKIALNGLILPHLVFVCVCQAFHVSVSTGLFVPLKMALRSCIVIY